MAWTDLGAWTSRAVVTKTRLDQISDNFDVLKAHAHTGSTDGAATLTAGNGSAAAPTYSASADTNTGVFFPTADTVGVATGGNERYRVDSAGRVLIGRTSVLGSVNSLVTAYSASTQPLIAVGGDAALHEIVIHTANAAAPWAAFRGIASGGTIASPTATPINAQLFRLDGRGYNNAATPALTSYKVVIAGLATEAWTTTAQGTNIVMQTTPIGSTTMATRLTLDDTQLLLTVPPVSTPPAAQNITSPSGLNITLPTTGFIKEVTTSGGSVTAVTLAAGTIDGQILIIFHSTATNTLTFAAAATSNVLGGTARVIRGEEAAIFIWDSGSGRWVAVADCQ